MGVSVQRYADVTVTHDILQRFGVHTRLRHIATEGMTAYMGRDFRKLNFVNAVILIADMLKVMLPMKGNHRHVILVQKQKT